LWGVAQNGAARRSQNNHCAPGRVYEALEEAGAELWDVQKP